MRRSKILMDPDFLRERAKVHIRSSDWCKALNVINISLDKIDEDELESHYRANKHLLLLRIQIRLALCHNEGALEDSLKVMSILPSDDPLLPKTLRLKGDALYQMGKMEHALMYYHRAKRAKTGNNHEYEIRVQMAVEAIKDSLIKPSKKTKFKINVEDLDLPSENRIIKTTELTVSKEHDKKNCTKSATVILRYDEGSISSRHERASAYVDSQLNTSPLNTR
ncbi:unnamed protein product [Lepeophtheirus salmonis]|uniref:(salmon louse) hypothetical protein n=1 Tax=Lepeophtheirus salmonis TaxID=72036 RepID=A0A7R8CTE9_LEPSM|nr:unnamed protein product [Lepeophtheirus salmonis]CAF2888104.1 unnamed protein product [Lepeophtheirus salmonis]